MAFDSFGGGWSSWSSGWGSSWNSGWSDISSSIQNTWNDLSWSMQNYTSSLNNTLNSWTTSAMDTMSTFGQSALYESQMWGSSLGMGLGYGIGEFGSNEQHFGYALGMGFEYAIDYWRDTIQQTWSVIGPDPGFGQRFGQEFYRSRLPGAEWLSPWPIPGEGSPKATAIIGPAGAGAMELVSRGIQRQLTIRATRDFTSFSGTRSFAYVSGLKSTYWAGSKFVQGILLAPTVFYGAYDIGTAIQGAIETWRE